MRFWSLCAVLGLTACSSSTFLQSGDGDAGRPSPGPISGGDGGSTRPPPPANCDINKLPTDDACVIDESAGLFVSSSRGSVQGDGSRAKPLATIQAGIDAAKATQRRVYVCAESYAEVVTLAESVSVFGYFDCASSWKVAAKRAVVLAPSSPAAIAKNVGQTTRVHALEIVAPDATAPSASSIALVAIGSGGLELMDVKLRAGKAGNGTDGADGVQLVDSGVAKNGSNASGNYTCNPNYQLTCGSGPTVLAAANACAGKANITPGAGGTNGAPGYMIAQADANSLSGWSWFTKVFAGPGGAQPASATTAQGGIENSSQPAVGANGLGGANGMPGADVGMFSPTGDYVAAKGVGGGDGLPGQGGGAGAGHTSLPGSPAHTSQGFYYWGARGGGGGAGGCPGLAGEVGGGGGASVALVAINSPMRFTSSTVESSTGGVGGKSGKPSTPSSGGTGGLANQGAQAGADGGWGGNAGISGNGAGGPSIAMAYSGTMPTAIASTLSPGVGGAGVPLRIFVDYNIPASPSGKSASSFSF